MADQEKESNYSTVFEHQNKLLQERNEMLQHENERMLCEIEMLHVELEHLRGQVQSKNTETGKREYDVLGDRQTHRRNGSTREQYEQLITLRVQRDQLHTLYSERLAVLRSKASKAKVSPSIRDGLGLLTSMESSSCFLGIVRGLFDLAERCLDASNSLEQRQSELTDRQVLLRLEQERRAVSNKENSRVLVVRDPQYIVQQTRWITKFEDEFRIVKKFYEQLIDKVVKREQHRQLRPTVHTILLRYEQLELRKLEMYRLAVRIDNEEREYRVRLGKGTSMESLRLSTAKLVECLTSEERQLNRLRSEIGELLERL